MARRTHRSQSARRRGRSRRRPTKAPILPASTRDSFPQRSEGLSEPSSSHSPTATTQPGALGRAENEITMRPPGQPDADVGEQGGCGCLAAKLLVGSLLTLMLFQILFDEGFPGGQTTPSLAPGNPGGPIRMGRPAPTPQPPKPRVAVLTFRLPGAAGQTRSIRFHAPSLEVRRVASEEAIDTVLRQRAIRLTPDSPASVSLPINPPAYILVGDIDLRVGHLEGTDVWKAAVGLSGDDIVDVFAGYFPDGEAAARGPPQEPIFVFVVGEIRQIDGPQQKQSSVVRLDLRPSEAELERYEREKREYLRHYQGGEIEIDENRRYEQWHRSSREPRRLVDPPRRPPRARGR